ncbi:MAG: U32 family peptidase [Clostridia bacterium]|nr:U32 family peptidase [Clostridia bacterium]
MKKVELLAPAGSFEKAKTAFLYGADAVYCGTSSLSLRTRVGIDDEELAKIIEYAHQIEKKVYVALNIYAWDEKYDEIIEQVKLLEKVKADGIIVADGGILEIAKQYAPNIPIHMSTQSNIVSLHSSNFWYKNGAKRMIMAREMSKEQLKYIMKNKPDDMETEIFVHGAICFAYSGRCFLSDFLTGRSANLGSCAQSCRWSYNLYAEERNNPGQLMPIETDEYGTSIFSSKDLCLIKELPEVIEMGIDSLKIEGRLKTQYYIASIINAYRNAIDDYQKDPKNYDYTKYLKELDKVKTRGITTFYFNDRDNKDIQEYSGKQYNEEYEFGGIILENNQNEKNNIVDSQTLSKQHIYTIEIRNRLKIGDIMEIIVPNKIEPVEFIINKLYDAETNEEIDVVNPGKQGQQVKIELPIECQKDWILRRKK